MLNFSQEAEDIIFESMPGTSMFSDHHFPHQHVHPRLSVDNAVIGRAMATPDSPISQVIFLVFLSKCFFILNLISCRPVRF